MTDVAFYLASGCSGCEMSMLDLAEKILDLDFRIVWAAPLLGDGKYERIPEVDVAFVEGGVRLSEHEAIVRELREKSEILVAFGVCASCGGIPGMANLHSKEEILETVFKRTLTTDNPDNVFPQKTTLVDGKYEVTLPEFYENLVPLNRVVEVDCYLGGCPPTPEQVEKAIEAILDGKRGWLTDGKSVCDNCQYTVGRMGGVRRFVRVAEDRCFIDQGLLCFGPATQGDCKAACIRAKSPCRGCGGPLPGVTDYGAKLIDLLASLLDEKGVEALSRNYRSLAKLLYMYSLPSATISSKVRRYHVREVER